MGDSEKSKDNIINNQKLFNMIQELNTEMTKIKIELNNGIKQSTQQNTQAIEGLKKNIKEIKEILKKEDGKKTGAKNERTRLWRYVAITSSLFGILGTLFGIGSLIGVI